VNQYTIVCLPVVVPIALWLWYHYRKDHYFPEPIRHLVLAFVLGMGSFYLGRYGYEALDFVHLRRDALILADTDRTALLFYSLGVIGPLEELAKLVPFLFIVIRFREFNEPIDGIIYASFIALGFAMLENVLYLQNATLAEALARGIAGPAVHVVFASIWGYYIGRAWLCKRRFGPIVLAAWLAAGLVHGAYNYLVFTWPAPMFPFSALVILLLWIWRLNVIKDLHARPAGPCPFDAPPAVEDPREF